MKRYFVVQRCDDRAGWEDCPELPAFDKEHEAVQAMETYTPTVQTTRVYALRVHRKPKGWTREV